MQDVLVRAGCFVAIIFLGYFLRVIGFFKEEDFSVLSRVVIKITLPAAIAVSFASNKLDMSLLSLAALGLGSGVLYMGLSYLINLRADKEEKAFDIINSAGYSLGTFTLPFVQSFLGPVGVITTSLFDIGNSVLCLGGTYSIATVIKDGGRFSIKKVLKTMSKSVALIVYAVMILLAVLKITVPAPMLSFAQIIRDANAFMAMLMIGVGIKFPKDLTQIRRIMKILILRYSVAALLALAFWFLLPFAMEVRRALVILVFSPLGSAAPGFTEQLKSDVGLASAVNTLTILCSIVFIVALLLILL